MARKTVDAKITQLETEISELETLLSDGQHLKSVEGTGREGAQVQFTSPKILQDRLQVKQNKLANLYRQKESC